MRKPDSWIIDNYEYRRGDRLSREFRLPVSLHGHTYHSEENIGRLNNVMKLPILRNIHEFINAAFREQAHDDLDYSDIHYCPPISPVEAYELELAKVKQFGWEELLFTITDHDKIAGCQEFQENRPELVDKTSISEELSLYYKKQVIHLGVHGIPADKSEEIHQQLQDMAQKFYFEGIFELLQSHNCLVILNHPLWSMKLDGEYDNIIIEFLDKFIWGIDAFEFNGLRTQKENDRVISLAQRYNKPLIGGGDRHTPVASVVYTASRDATTFADFIQEIKGGFGITIITRDYFQSHGWKLFVRILQYFQSYREIAFYKKMPLSTYPIPDRIPLDYAAELAGWLTKVFTRWGLVR